MLSRCHVLARAALFIALVLAFCPVGGCGTKNIGTIIDPSPIQQGGGSGEDTTDDDNDFVVGSTIDRQEVVAGEETTISLNPVTDGGGDNQQQTNNQPAVVQTVSVPADSLDPGTLISGRQVEPPEELADYVVGTPFKLEVTNPSGSATGGQHSEETQQKLEDLLVEAMLRTGLAPDSTDTEEGLEELIEELRSSDDQADQQLADELEEQLEEILGEEDEAGTNEVLAIVEFKTNGLPLDAADTTYDIVRISLDSNDEYLFDYGWAKIENGCLTKLIVPESDAIYCVMDMDGVVESHSASSYGVDVPLLTADEPNNSTATIPTLYNIVLVHGNDYEHDPYYKRSNGSYYSTHWNTYAPQNTSVESQPLLQKVKETQPAYLDEITIWRFYFDTIEDHIYGQAGSGWNLASEIKNRIIEKNHQAKIIFVCYSQGGPTVLAAYDNLRELLQQEYPDNPEIIDEKVIGFVSLNSNHLGSEWINAIADNSLVFFFPEAKRPGVLDLRSIYNFSYDPTEIFGRLEWLIELIAKYQYDVPELVSIKLVKKANEKLLELTRKKENSSLFEDNKFYSVSSIYSANELDDIVGLSNKQFQWFTNQYYKAIQLYEIEGKWKLARLTRLYGPLHDDLIPVLSPLGDPLTDQVHAYYSQERKFLENDESLPLPEHSSSHIEVIEERNSDALAAMQDAIYKIITGDEPLEANITIDPNPASAQQIVKLSAESSTGDISTIAWDLNNDGSFTDAYGRVIYKAFNAVGVYPISVIVRDKFGNPDVDTALLKVGGPLIDCVIPKGGYIGQHVTYVALMDAGYSNDRYKWTLNEKAFDDYAPHVELDEGEQFNALVVKDDCGENYHSFWTEVVQKADTTDIGGGGEKEPNNTLSSANSLPLDAKVSGKVKRIADETDFWVFTIDNPGLFNIVVKNDSSSNVDCAILDDNGRYLFGARDAPVGENEVIPEFGLDAGTYYAVAYPANDLTEESINTYEIYVEYEQMAMPSNGIESKSNPSWIWRNGDNPGKWWWSSNDDSWVYLPGIDPSNLSPVSSGENSNYAPLAVLITLEPNTDVPILPIGEAPFAVKLSGALSVDIDGKISLYEWDCDGNGEYEYSSDESSIIHVFETIGLYDVSLKVTDDQGASDRTTETIRVTYPSTAVRPVADLKTMIDPKTGLNTKAGVTPHTVRLTAEGSTGEGLDYYWDFDRDGIYGEGQFDNPQHEAFYTGGSLAFPVYSSGDYLPRVKVVDVYGAFDEAGVDVDVNYKPVAALQVVPSPAVGLAPLQVTLDSTASSDVETLQAYLVEEWDLNGDGVFSGEDGATAEENEALDKRVVIKTYAEENQQVEVSVKVYDSWLEVLGEECLEYDIASVTVDTTPVPAYVVSVSHSGGTEYQWYLLSAEVEGVPDTFTYAWDFGGACSAAEQASEGAKAQPIITLQDVPDYQAAQMFAVSLTADNGYGEPDVYEFNWSTSAVTHAVQGSITNQRSGGGVSGVDVILTHPTTGSVFGASSTTTSGLYSAINVVDGTFTVTPAKTGWWLSNNTSTYSPTRTVSVQDANVVSQGFAAYSRILSCGLAEASELSGDGTESNPYVLASNQYYEVKVLDYANVNVTAECTINSESQFYVFTGPSQLQTLAFGPVAKITVNRNNPAPWPDDSEQEFWVKVWDDTP